MTCFVGTCVTVVVYHGGTARENGAVTCSVCICVTVVVCATGRRVYQHWGQR